MSQPRDPRPFSESRVREIVEDIVRQRIRAAFARGLAGTVNTEPPITITNPNSAGSAIALLIDDTFFDVVDNELTFKDAILEKELDDLTDVNAPSPNDGDVLSYNTGNSNWEATLPPVVPSDLDDLDDVNAPTPDDGDVLTYNTSEAQWEPTAPTAPSDLPAGVIAQFAGTVIPAGWLQCDGTEVSRTTYADLFDAIGTTWGEGDGSTTFNLPDARGRTPIGAGQGPGLTDRVLASMTGTETHTLTAAQIPRHSHTLGTATTTGFDSKVVRGAEGFGNTMQTGVTGGGQSHPNMQPSLVFNMIVKT